MTVANHSQRRLTIALCLLVLLSFFFVGSSAAARADSQIAFRDSHHAVQAGVDLERSRDWLRAIEHYEATVKQWPDSKELQYGLRRSKIHFGIERRYADDSFHSSMLALSQTRALERFDEVLSKVQRQFVEPLSTTSFVAHGTESMYLALANEKFRDQYLFGVEDEQIKELRKLLRDEYWNKPVFSQQDAHRVILEVCGHAQRIVGLSATPVIMEYVFGGCNALDDYSHYLTPDRLSDLYDNIEGEFVGLGIEMKAELGKGMLLVNVLPDSPALEGGVYPGDHIVSIDGVDCRDMTTDEAARLLRGPVQSRVRLGVQHRDSEEVDVSSFVRRPVHINSVPEAKIIDKQQGIGYIRMTGFQKNTVSELDDALRTLHQQGMRSLIWDLRGNPGGLLTAAVEVLDRFIDEGGIVSTKGRTQDQNWSYSAHRPGTWKMPLVLLVDGNSASASEIVAGAIGDHRRGTIVGRKTYGKWSVQSIFPVQGSTGIRLTTAKFYSPHGRTLSKIGVRPDIEVPKAGEHKTFHRPGDLASLLDDADIQKAVEVLSSQVTQR